MQTMKLQSCVGEDGVLRLNVPIGLTNTELEVVLVVQPVVTLTNESQPRVVERDTAWERIQQARQQHTGQKFSDSVELLREDRQR